MAKSSGGKGSSGSGWNDDPVIGGDVGINLGSDFSEGGVPFSESASEKERVGLFSGAAQGGDLAMGAASDVGVIDVVGVAGDSGDSSRGGIVAARGTVDGLVIRVDGRVESTTLRQALDEFVSARSSFLAGQEIFLEWVGMRPALDIEESLTH